MSTTVHAYMGVHVYGKCMNVSICVCMYVLIWEVCLTVYVCLYGLTECKSRRV